MYAARSAASAGLRAARDSILGCGVWIMASNDAVVVVGLLAISAKDGALVHPGPFFPVTTWHRLQTVWASLCPSARPAAGPTDPATTGRTMATNPYRAIRGATFIACTLC